MLAALLAVATRAILTFVGAGAGLILIVPNPREPSTREGSEPPLAEAPTDLRVGPIIVKGLTGGGAGEFLASYAAAFDQLAAAVTRSGYS
jgi:hypothetical protein